MISRHWLVRELAHPSQKFEDPAEMLAYYRRRKAEYDDLGKLHTLTVWAVTIMDDDAIDDLGYRLNADQNGG